MRAPKFWQTGGGALPFLLWPLSMIWKLGTKARALFMRPQKVDAPVICVGNITAGGAGKTPIVMALAEALADRTPAILCRGYGVPIRKPIRVDLERHTARDVGDEALLLARVAPTYVSFDRLAAARQAVADGAKLILMDDGFHHPHLYKDMSLLVANGTLGFGNGFTIPAGPCRENPDSAVGRADALLVSGENHHDSLHREWGAAPVFVFERRLQLPENPGPYLAFAGIAYPDIFFSMLEAAGVKLIGRWRFDDHQFYKKKHLDFLSRWATEAKATLITTEKDAARLPKEFPVTVAPLQLCIPDGFMEWITATLDGRGE